MRYVLASWPSNRGDDTVVIGINMHEVQRGRRRCSLTRSMMRIVRVLAVHGCATTEDLLDALYYERKEPPDTLYLTLRVLLYKLRARLTAVGLRIISRSGQGYWLEEA